MLTLENLLKGVLAINPDIIKTVLLIDNGFITSQVGKEVTVEISKENAKKLYPERDYSNNSYWIKVKAKVFEHNLYTGSVITEHGFHSSFSNENVSSWETIENS